MSVRWTSELVAWIRFRFRRAERYVTVDRVHKPKPNCTLSEELLREIELARREAPAAPPFRGRVGV